VNGAVNLSLTAACNLRSDIGLAAATVRAIVAAYVVSEHNNGVLESTGLDFDTINGRCPYGFDHHYGQGVL
jgi:hypothetical protein